MKIEHTETLTELEHNKNGEAYIISELVAICKEMDEFNTDSGEIDSEIKELEKKVKKRQNVLAESDRIESDMNEKLKTVKDYNFKLRTALLEKLGSEL